jgi:hypothetical protein
MLLCLELGRLVRMLLVLVKRLVLFSGSHGERCLPLAVMLVILMLRRAGPEALCTLWSCPKARAQDGSPCLLGLVSLQAASANVRRALET